jgi:two-component system, LytTR family, sensor kinase
MVGRYGLTSKRVLTHSFFWVLYVIVSGLLTGLQAHDYAMGIKAEAIMLPVKMALTYYVLLFALPMYTEDAHRHKSIFLTITAFLLTSLVYRMVQVEIIFPHPLPLKPWQFFSPRGFLLVFFDLFTAVAAALSVKLTRMYIRSKRQSEKLEKEKLRSELNYLRTQTNPHYLFNTLNTLYGLALRRDDHTPEAILRLSKIMDFTLHQSRKYSVPLEEEVHILHSIINLERLRSTQVPDILFVEQIDDPTVMIAPMLLVPYVENAFKHGVATAPEKPFVHVHITQDLHELHFSVKNNFKIPEHTSRNKENLGLQNVQRQLELLYANAYTLSIEKKGDLHSVDLKLNLEKLLANDY